MKCYYCQVHFSTINELVDHTRTKCSSRIFGREVGFRCSVCMAIYADSHGWRKHLLLRHPDPVIPLSPGHLSDHSPASSRSYHSPRVTLTPHRHSSSVFSQKSPGARRQLFSPSTHALPTQPECPPEPHVVTGVGVPHGSSAEYLTTTFARAFSSLHADTGVTSKTVQKFADIMHMVLQEGIDHAIDSSIVGNLHGDGELCVHLVEGLNGLKTCIQRGFRSFTTNHLREKYFRRLGTYVEPISVELGPALTSIGRNPPTMTTSTAQLVPLQTTLKRIFSMPGLMEEVDAYINATSLDENLTNIVHSQSWKDTVSELNIPSTSSVLPLLVYYDDFECGNPLGSHAGIHKLGGMYVSLPCLPPRFASQLSYIFLQYIFHSSDRTNFGNRVTFAPVIDQLNLLATEGINIKTEYYEGNIRFGVAAIVGDNLGLHGMLGFAEGFTANFPCRICRATREQCGEMLVENKKLLRNNLNYAADVAASDLKTSGVRQECVWLRLKGFNLFRNVGVDAMHDINEGISKYLITVVLNSLISEGAFDLSYLNNRLLEFNFGPDSDNKPPPLSMEKGSVKVKMSATESSHFVTYFGLLVGHKIPRFDMDDDAKLSTSQKCYHLYILLRKCVELVMARHVSEGMAVLLEEYVAKMNALYLEIGKTPLQPKFHHLLHYPQMLLKFGPVSHLWSMRFEAKHKVGKKAARASASRVNLCKTVAKKIQLQLNDLFVQNTLRPPVFTTSMGHSAHPSVVSELVRQLPHLPRNPVITSHAFVTSPNNVTYRRKDVIHVGLDSECMYPVFGEIQELYYEKISGECYASVIHFETAYFDNHFLAYKVCRTTRRGFVALRNLFHALPNTRAYTGSKCPELMIVSRNMIV